MRTAPQLVAAFADTITAVNALVHEFDDDDWARPTGCPGWSVLDQVSHIADLESVLAGRPRAEVDVPDLPHVQNDISRFMEVGVESRRGRTPADVIAELTDITAVRLAELAALTEDTDVKGEITGFFGPVPLGRFLGIRTVDVYSHEQDIRRATGHTGHESGPAAELTIDRYSLGWTSTLAGALPDGATLRVEITGPTTRSLGFRGSGDGVEKTEPSEAHVVLTMPFGVALALMCGRTDADPANVDVTGDDAIAKAVLANLAVAP